MDFDFIRSQCVGKAMMNYLGCSCTFFEPMDDDDPIMDAYHRARQEGSREGFVPVLVTVDEILRGERAAAPQPPQAQDALYRIAAYTQGEREAFARRLHGLLTAGAASGVLYGALLALGLAEDGPFAPVASSRGLSSVPMWQVL